MHSIIEDHRGRRVQIDYSNSRQHLRDKIAAQIGSLSKKKRDEIREISECAANLLENIEFYFERETRQ